MAEISPISYIGGMSV